jgi:hypothetical protein
VLKTIPVSPARIEGEVSSYSAHLFVDEDLDDYANIRISLTDKSGVNVRWEGKPVLKTGHGEGNWRETNNVYKKTMLSCPGEIDPSTDTRPCGSVDVNTPDGGLDTYVALPNFKDNRFSYVSTSQNWQSLISVNDILPSSTQRWWVITNFFHGNPASYGWLDIELEIIKRKERGFNSMVKVLDDLRQSNIVSYFWKEQEVAGPARWERSPVLGWSKLLGLQDGSIAVSCPNPTAVTIAQCQGACFYLGYPTAVSYGHQDGNGLLKGQCRCAPSCTVGIESNFGQVFSIFKWFEGFYYMPQNNTVRVLAYTDQDDGININMWVQVSDECGNTALGLVEFWVAPSVDVAASQGRTCVLATATSNNLHDSDAVDAPFAFTSDDVVTPGGVKTRSAISQFLEGDGADMMKQTDLDMMKQMTEALHNSGLEGDDMNGDVDTPWR